MEHHSLNQISSEDLDKINKYIDQISARLTKDFPSDRIQEAKSNIREQIFQDIELSVATTGNFDIDKIILENKSKNQNLFYAKAKDEVVFRVKKPQFLRPTQLSGTVNQGGSPTGDASSQSDTSNPSENTQNSTRGNTSTVDDQVSRSIFLAKLLLLLTFISGIYYYLDYFNEFVLLPLTLLYFTIHLIFVKYPVKELITADYVLISFYTVFVLPLIDSFHAGYFETVIFILMIPVIVFNLMWKIYKTDEISKKSSSFLLNYPDATNLFFKYFLIVNLVMFGPFLFQNIVANQLYHPFIYAILMILLYSIKIQDKLTNWNEKYFGQYSSERIEQYGPVKGRNEGTQDTVVQQSSPTIQTNRFEATNFFASGKVDIDVNLSDAKTYTKFKALGILRVLLLIIFVGLLSILVYLNTRNEWALIYHMRQFGMTNNYGDQIPSNMEIGRFLDNMNQMLYFGLMAIYVVFMLDLIIEFFRWLGRRKVNRVIKYLMINQGVLDSQILVTPPQGMDVSKYKDILGELVMNGIIKIKHLEGSK